MQCTDGILMFKIEKGNILTKRVLSNKMFSFFFKNKVLFLKYCIFILMPIEILKKICLSIDYINIFFI